MKKILVTGADGFIGSHLTEELVRKGYETKAFVLYNSFSSWGWLDHCGPDVRDQFEVFAGDIRDPHGVRQAMEGCEAVLHLAALIAIPYIFLFFSFHMMILMYILLYNRMMIVLIMNHMQNVFQCLRLQVKLY